MHKSSFLYCADCWWKWTSGKPNREWECSWWVFFYVSINFIEWEKQLFSIDHSTTKDGILNETAYADQTTSMTWHDYINIICFYKHNSAKYHEKQC